MSLFSRMSASISVSVRIVEMSRIVSTSLFSRGEACVWRKYDDTRLRSDFAFPT